MSDPGRWYDEYAAELAAKARRKAKAREAEDVPGIPRLAFQFGDVVHMRHDEDPVAGVVTSIELRPGTVLYGVTWVDSRSESRHYEFELAAGPGNDFHGAAAND